MNPLGVETPRSPSRAPDNPADALATVIDNAAALARAELRLAAAEAKAWLVRIGLGVSLLCLGLLLTQTFVLLTALAALFVGTQAWPRVVLTLLLALAAPLAAFLFGARELRRLKELRHESHLDH